jgi:hypothetical protein
MDARDKELLGLILEVFAEEHLPRWTELDANESSFHSVREVWEAVRRIEQATGAYVAPNLHPPKEEE